MESRSHRTYAPTPFSVYTVNLRRRILPASVILSPNSDSNSLFSPKQSGQSIVSYHYIAHRTELSEAPEPWRNWLLPPGAHCPPSQLPNRRHGRLIGVHFGIWNRKRALLLRYPKCSRTLTAPRRPPSTHSIFPFTQKPQFRVLLQMLAKYASHPTRLVSLAIHFCRLRSI